MSRIATLIFGFALAKVTETGIPAWWVLMMVSAMAAFGAWMLETDGQP